MMVVNLGVLYFLHIIDHMSRLVFLMTWLLYVISAFVWRSVHKRLLLHRVAGIRDAKAVVIITDKENLESIAEELSRDIFRDLFIAAVFLESPGNVTGREELPILGDTGEACDYICRNWVDEVFLYLPGREELQKKLEDQICEMGVTVHSAAMRLERFSGETRREHVEMIGQYVVLTEALHVISFQEALLKRLLDIAGGLVGCLITGLLFVVVGPLIKKASEGPVIYSQIRIGRGGREFRMYKFRTMVQDADSQKEALKEHNIVKDGMMFKIENDPRIIGSGKTDRKGNPRGIGYFLRRTSLDEFPQFFNVLKGDMSIVGTRPPLPDEWEKYQYHHRVRMGIRPGITGLWQSGGRNEITDFEEVVRLDLEYIRNWSLLMDIKIILRTAAQLFQKKGQ